MGSDEAATEMLSLKEPPGSVEAAFDFFTTKWVIMPGSCPDKERQTSIFGYPEYKPLPPGCLEFGSLTVKSSDARLRADFLRRYGKQDPTEPKFLLHGSTDPRDPQEFHLGENMQELWTCSVVDESRALFWPTFSITKTNIRSYNLRNSPPRVLRKRLEELSRERIGTISVWERTKPCDFTLKRFGMTLPKKDMKEGVNHVYGRLDYRLTIEATKGGQWPDAYLFTAEAAA